MGSYTPLRYSWIHWALRSLLVFFSWYYWLNWLHEQKEMPNGLKNIFFNILYICVISLESFPFFSIFYEAPVLHKTLPIPEYQRFNKKHFCSIAIRVLLLLPFLVMDITQYQFLNKLLLANVAVIIVDMVVTVDSARYYRKLGSNEFEMLTKSLKDMIGEDADVTNLAKTAQSGDFAALQVPLSQITEVSEGSVAGGLVLSKGKFVYYCESQEYVSRANRCTALQSREYSLRIEHRVLKGEDAEEDELTAANTGNSKECKLSIDPPQSRPTSSMVTVWKPAGGYRSFAGREYVLLEDCRTIEKELETLEKRLVPMRAANRELRDAIKREMKKEQAVDEPKDEKINSVD